MLVIDYPKVSIELLSLCHNEKKKVKVNILSNKYTYIHMCIHRLMMMIYK